MKGKQEMTKRAVATNTDKVSKTWNKPEIYKLRVNETFGGTNGNGETDHPLHKPKASV